MGTANKQQSIWKVISASSMGTLIEWYDFYIFGSLATIISKQFFPENAGTAALLSTLAIFAAGFIVRPFGALVFGRLGDLVGRKYTFLLTLVLMGGSTFAIGLIPGYKSIGVAAPLLVLLLRLVQGLALGGEYGGAATYVAEHAAPSKRGFFTSWIQTTATLGLFLSLGVILFTRSSLGTEKFNAWGWRVPFWVSIALVGVSIYIRMKMHESPMFSKLKKEGKVSSNPLRESFSKKENLRMVLLALFGAVMGQGVIWYTGQFYAQSFLENTCKLDFEQSRTILLYAILLATPFFVFFGWLSDKVGRKWIMLGGMLLGIVTYRPIYQKFLDLTNASKTAVHGISHTREAVSFKTDVQHPERLYLVSKLDTVYANGSVFKYTKTDTVTFAEASSIPANTGTLHLRNTAGEQRSIHMGNGPEFSAVYAAISAKPDVKVEKRLGTDYWTIVWLIFVQILYVTMVYGPIAAFLVEMFPTKIRYTSMSLPYHIGNGVFGGLVPFLSTLIIEYSKSPQKPGGDPLSGLWYPIGVAAVCLVIGLFYLSNETDEDVSDDVNVYLSTEENTIPEPKKASV